MSTLTRSVASVLRFTLGVRRVPNLFGAGNRYSDLGRSKKILFWEVK